MKLKNIAGFKKEARLRVLLYHDIASEDRVAFERQLNWLSQRWSFISPEYFTEVLNGEKTIQKEIMFQSQIKAQEICFLQILNVNNKYIYHPQIVIFIQNLL